MAPSSVLRHRFLHFLLFRGTGIVPLLLYRGIKCRFQTTRTRHLGDWWLGPHVSRWLCGDRYIVPPNCYPYVVIVKIYSGRKALTVFGVGIWSCSHELDKAFWSHRLMSPFRYGWWSCTNIAATKQFACLELLSCYWHFMSVFSDWYRESLKLRCYIQRGIDSRTVMRRFCVSQSVLGL